jgi:hypothetical protein
VSPQLYPAIPPPTSATEHEHTGVLDEAMQFAAMIFCADESMHETADEAMPCTRKRKEKEQPRMHMLRAAGHAAKQSCKRRAGRARLGAMFSAEPENLAEIEHAAKLEAYWAEHLRQSMLDCIIPPLFTFQAFRIQKDYWYDCFLSVHTYRTMHSSDKEQYKTVLKQSNVLELFGACGYLCDEEEEDGIKYKVFTWDGCYAAKQAYRFASVKCSPKIKQHSTSNGNSSKRYQKIRCPNDLQKCLVRLYSETTKLGEEGKKTRGITKFVTISDFQFLTPTDLATRLEDNRFFFPFETLRYDTQIMPKLFTIYDSGATDMLSYDTTPTLQLTQNAKCNIQEIHQWIVNAYARGSLQIILN